MTVSANYFRAIMMDIRFWDPQNTDREHNIEQSDSSTAHMHKFVTTPVPVPDSDHRLQNPAKE